MPKINDYPRKRFIVRDGKLYLRTTFEDGKKNERCLGLNADGFDKKKQKYLKNKALNETLKDILLKTEPENDVVTFESLVYDYIESHELSSHTEEIWRSFLKKIEDCFENVEDFNAGEFVKYMEDEDMSESTIVLYLSKCKALKFDVPVKYRKNYKYQQREVWLDKVQMAVLRKFLLDFLKNNEPEKIFKTNSEICALWVYYLCYLTALSPIDLMTLERKQISENEKCWFITGKRQKTRMRYKIPILKTPVNKKIFGKVIDLNKSNLYFMPIMNGIEDKKIKIANRLSNKTRLLTKNLKKLIEEKVNPYIEQYNSKLTIGKPVDPITVDNLTLNSARHSMTMKLLNEKIPPAQLSLMLGRSISTIQQYFHTLKNEQMDELTKALEDNIIF